MTVTCNDLLSLKYFSRIQLVAGAGGLNRSITWPFIGQTVEISPWVHGGELLFITGIVHTEAMLPALLQECIRKKLAGLVVLVGSDYIQDIPPNLVEQAENAQFPLFSMSFQLKLIDVTKEISDLIVRNNMKRKKEEDFLDKLLFGPESELPELVGGVLQNGGQAESSCFVCMFNLSATPAEHPENVDYLQQHIASLCAAKYLKIFTMVHSNSVICLVISSSQEKARAAAAYLESSQEVLSQLCNDTKLVLSFGRIYDSSAHIRTSHKEAASALQLARKIDQFRVVHYQKLGIYYLLLKMQDTDGLHRYYHDCLDPLLEHDRQSNADLVPTLRAYLLCNGNIAKTAQKIFVHRNTLIYRLNQIRDLLACDLEDAWTRMNFFVSLLTMDYLEGKPESQSGRLKR